MTASRPSSRSRMGTISITQRLYRERRAAAAGRLHVRIVELEAGALQALDVVDLRAREIHQAHLVDDALDACGHDLAIDLGGLVEVEVVREAGAAAADHAETERHAALDPFGIADLVDLRRSSRSDEEHRLGPGGVEFGCHGSSELGHIACDLTLT